MLALGGFLFPDVAIVFILVLTLLTAASVAVCSYVTYRRQRTT